jgi:hypothetical protein
MENNSVDLIFIRGMENNIVSSPIGRDFEVLPKGWTVKVVKESGLCSN